jgi:hypothetical protein
MPKTFQDVTNTNAKIIRRLRVFQWKKWENPDPTDVRGPHDHCLLCWATICDRFPGPKRFPSAYVSTTDDKYDFWLCRSCFKIVQKPLDLIRLGRDGITER